MSEPIRLFIGAAANSIDLESQMVAEFTARKHCSLPLEITWMIQAPKGPYAGWNCATGRTPFSHFRWSIPAMCGYEGKGIYTDVDFIFRADLAELWNQDVPGVFLAKVGKKGNLHKTCCMLFDCAKAKGHVPDLPVLRKMVEPQGQMIKYFETTQPPLFSAFDGDWNAIDAKGYESVSDPRIKAIHYSRIEMQPQLKYALPRLKKEGKAHWYTGPTGPHERADLIALFDQCYSEALAAGYSLDDYRTAEFSGATRRNFTYTHSKVTA